MHRVVEREGLIDIELLAANALVNVTNSFEHHKLETTFSINLPRKLKRMTVVNPSS